jgi:hypothetical protein
MHSSPKHFDGKAPILEKRMPPNNFPQQHPNGFNKKFDCGVVRYGRATADCADAAQLGRVNVASGFRQTQKLQVAKSAKRSEVLRPSFNQVFHASLSTCL